MFLLYSLGFNADLLSEEYCVYGTLDNCAESSLHVHVLQHISWCYKNEWLPSNYVENFVASYRGQV
jgi:hypothetical protein